MSEPVVRSAVEGDESVLGAIYNACSRSLLDAGILQWGDWDGGYPGSKFIDNSISRGDIYILTEGGDAAGAVVVNDLQSPEWDAISWSGLVKNPAVIHALVIAPAFQGRGLSKLLLGWCEETALSGGYDGIRLDAFEKNKVSNLLYAGFGYEPRGRVVFDSKPENNRTYICYEKLLGQEIK